MIIKKYKHFLLLESVLELDPTFYNIMGDFYRGGNRIAKYIYDLYRNDTDVKTNVNKVDISQYKNSEVTFLPDSQYQRIKDTSEVSNRTRSVGNIGRIIRQILKDNKFEFTDKELEDFINLYKARWDKDYSGRKVEIVKGDDILFWYNEDNYYSNSGTLGNSCMRSPGKNHFMKMYAENPDSVSLVILTHNNKLMGRSLLWKVGENSLGLDYFSDRIYYRFDSDATLIRDWVKDNVKGKIGFYDDGLDEDDDKIKIDLKKVKFDKYPYMDTFVYLCLELNKIEFEGVEVYEPGDTGFLIPFYDDSVDGLVYTIQDTGGGKSLCGKFSKCAYSRYLVNTNDFVYISGYGNVYKGFVNKCKYLDRFFLKKDSVWSECMKDWVPKSQSIEHPKYGIISNDYIIDVIISLKEDKKISPFECQQLFKNSDIDGIKEWYNVEEGFSKDAHKYRGFHFSKEMYNTEYDVPNDMLIELCTLKSGFFKKYPEVFPVSPYGDIDEITFKTFNIPNSEKTGIKHIPIVKFVANDPEIYFKYKTFDKSKLNTDYVDEWSKLLEDYHHYCLNTSYNYEGLYRFYEKNGLDGVYKSIVEFTDTRLSGKGKGANILKRIIKDYNIDIKVSLPVIRDLVKMCLLIFLKSGGSNGLGSFLSVNAPETSIDFRRCAAEISLDFRDEFIKFLSRDKGTDSAVFQIAKYRNDDEILRLLQVKF